MINMLKNLHKEESGQDLIEYELIALIVALGAIAGMGALAQSINGIFTSVAGTLIIATRPAKRVPWFLRADGAGCSAACIACFQ